MMASNNERDKLVNMLLKKGVDINYVDQQGWDILMVNSQIGDDAFIDLLIKAGADVHRVNRNGFGALIIASQLGHGKVVNLLVKRGSDIHHVDGQGLNALMHASLNGHNTVVDILIKCGADIHHVQEEGWNALMIASDRGHHKVVEILIKGGADIHRVKQNGYNALMIASNNGYDTIVDLLNKHGSDIHHVDEKGWDALILASQNGHDKVVEILIKGKADIHHVDQIGFNALMMASNNGKEKIVDLLIKSGSDIHHVDVEGCNSLMLSCKNGHYKVVDILMKVGADIHHVAQNGSNALMTASFYGHDAVVDILIQGGADIHYINQEGCNALMIASLNGHEKIVDILIKSGVDIHYVEQKGFNALLIASQNGHDKVVDILLKHGAEIDHINQEGLDALMMACENGSDKVIYILIKWKAVINRVTENGVNALMIASQKGHDKVVDILIKAGADINHVENDRWNALMIASQNGHDKTVDILINHGADIHRVEQNGRDTLMITSQYGYDKVVDLLIKHGSDIHRVDVKGYNALMIASKNGHDKVVDILSKCGADIHNVNEDGVNALIIASHAGHDKVVDILIKCGADIHYGNENGCNALMHAIQNGHDRIVEMLMRCGAGIHHLNQNGFNALMMASYNGHDKVLNILLNKEIMLTNAHHNKLNLTMQSPKKRNGISCVFTLYLIDVCFTAFENGHKRVIEMISSFGFKDCDLMSTTLFHSIIELLIKALNQVELQDTAQELNYDDIIRTTNINLQTFNKSISSYLNIVICKHNKQEIPLFFDILAQAETIMAEYYIMEPFDALQFFIYQKTLNKIFDVLLHYYKDMNIFMHLFFQLLLEHGYLDLTIKCIKEQNLLDINAPDFSVSLVRDMLKFLWTGSALDEDFAWQLAECNIVSMFAELLIVNKDNETSEWNYITHCMVNILHSIAYRKELRGYFKDINLRLVLSGYTFSYTTKLSAYILPVLVHGCSEEEHTSSADGEQILLNYIKEATKKNNKVYNGYPLNVLLQGLSILVKHHYTEEKILPLLETFVKILGDENILAQEYTTDCLKNMSSKKEASVKIISNDELTDLLAKLNLCGHKEIADNVNSIFWRSSRTSGILSTKLDKIVSDDFPKEFTVQKAILGQGAFGSVHLVIDSCKPKKKKFVAKKLYLKNEEDMELCKQEAMILLKTKHKRIVQFHGIQKKNNALFIFLEYIKNGTLSSFISLRGNLDEKITGHFTIQILEGVDYLHQNNILHRDIKGNNILMDDKMNIKLTDFGISEFIDGNDVATEKGTMRYMAPEVMYTDGGKIKHYTTRADIW